LRNRQWDGEHCHHDIGIAHYIRQILTQFEMMNAINASTPLDCNIDPYNNVADKEVDVKQYLRIVDSLMYGSFGTRPDISFAVTTLSRFNSKPLKMHMTAAKYVSRYFKHTSKLKLNFQAQGKSTNLIGFTDWD
jgi:hypothetical protein